MKVRYIKDHTDEFGQFFKAGCVAEHTDAEAARRKSLGVCADVDQAAYSRNQPPEIDPSIECAPKDQPGAKRK